MSRSSNERRLTEETQAFFLCLYELGKVPIGEDGSPVYRNHPADEWTLRALNKLSVNGSFT